MPTPQVPRVVVDAIRRLKGKFSVPFVAKLYHVSFGTVQNVWDGTHPSFDAPPTHLRCPTCGGLQRPDKRGRCRVDGTLLDSPRPLLANLEAVA